MAVANRGVGGLWLAAGAVVLALGGCNNPGATTGTSAVGVPATADGQTANGGTANAGTPASVQHLAVSDSFTPQGIQAPGSLGNGGDGGEGPIVAPYGISTTCGDGIVGTDEECDDGPGTALDACTPGCQTRDQPAVALGVSRGADRYLGAGRHPVAGFANGFVTTYMEVGADEPTVGATLFDIWGRPAHHVTVSDGASPIDDANPVAAALPGGSYAIAWGDFDGDGSDLGVALRQVNADGTLGALQSANSLTEFSQLNPDMVWTGSELVVAWEDYSDASNGPDLRYRTFDAELNPTSDDLVLADSALPEAAVALTKLDSGWAAAYRDGAVDGTENIVVKVGAAAFRVGPIYGGPLDDRPALVGLDATHLLVVFSAGTAATGSDVYNLPRLRYAVVDTQSAVAPSIQSVDPLDDVYTANNQIAQLEPSVVKAAEGAYIAWRSEARPGDGSGDQIWLKYLRWTTDGASFRIHGDESELLIPRTCDDSIGDQRAPALATTQLPPGNALAIAWTDFAKTQGKGAGEPDVVVHYAPTHITSPPAAPQRLSETWSGATGTSWPARWSSNAVAPVTLKTQYGEGEFNALATPGSAFGLVNDHTAENVDIVTTMRFGYPTYGAIIARANSTTNPTSYLGALVTTKKADVWRLFSVVNGVNTNLQTFALPISFFEIGYGVLVDYRVRLRTLTNADGTLFMAMKVWRAGAPEPAAWLLQTTLPTTSPTVQALGAVAGNFGLWANVATANGGTVDFDDFNATYFEGATAGNLDAATSPYPLLLPRAVATYRVCNGTTPCTQTGGCCSSNGDCASGFACSAYQSEGLGLGSDASICTVAHCADSIKDGTEVRADCGGADCKACDCTSALALGTSGYCAAATSTAAACLCGQGEYPCSRDAQCLPGLICGVDTGEPFGAPFGTDACVPRHCTNRVLDADETKIDCGGSCGSNCNVCSTTNGAIGHCRTYCQCTSGQGYCYQDDECVSPLICAAKGTRYGFATNINVCLPASCTNNVKDTALGETSTDCGGACGCGGCPAGCH